jgi:hypothetical protein
MGRRKKRHPVLWALGVIALVAAVLMGYQFSTNSGVFANEQPPTQSIPAKDPKVIGKDDTGADITASGTAVPTKLKAEPAKSAIAPQFRNYKAPTKKWHITSITPSGKLPAPVQITLPLDHQAGKNDLVLVAVNHTHTADGWTYQSGTLTPDKRGITFTVTELSWFTPFWTDLVGMVTELKEQFIDGMSSDVFAEAKKPECSNEPQARADDYKISSDSKDTIYWCFGVENNQRIVKIVNRRHYPLEIKTSNLKVLSRGKFELDLAQLANMGDHLVLNAGDEAKFAVSLNHDGKATVNTDVSSLAITLHAVDVLAEVIATIVFKVNPKSTKEIKKIVEQFMSGRCVINTMSDPSNIGHFIKECFNEDILKEAFNWQAALLAPVMLGFAAYGVGQSIVSALNDSKNGRAKYQVTVTRPKPNPFRAYIGDEWGRHLSSLQIKPDGTGHMKIDSGAGGIPGCGTGVGYCGFQGNFRSTPNSDGSLTATFTKVWATLDSDENIVPMPPDYVENMPHVGDSITIKSFFDNTLLIQQHGKLAQNDIDVTAYGKTYRGYVWCGPNSSNDPTAPTGSAVTQQCGA